MEIKRTRGKVIQKCKSLPSSSIAYSPKEAIDIKNNKYDDNHQFIPNKLLNLNGIYSKPKDVHRGVRKIRSVANLTSVEDLDIELEGTSRIIPFFNHEEFKRDSKRARNKSVDNTQYISLPIPEPMLINDLEFDDHKELHEKIDFLEKENKELQRDNQKLKASNTELKAKLSTKDFEDIGKVNTGRANNNKELIRINQENQELKQQLKQLQLKFRETRTKTTNNQQNKLFVKNEIKNFILPGQKAPKSKGDKLESNYKALERKYDLIVKEKEKLKLEVLQYKNRSTKDNKAKANYNSNNPCKEIQQEEYVDLWNNDEKGLKKFEDGSSKNKNEEEETRDSNWVNSIYKENTFNKAKEADFFEDGEDFYVKTEKEPEPKADLEKKSPIMELMNDKLFGLCLKPKQKEKSSQSLKPKYNKLASNNFIPSILQIKKHNTQKGER